MTDSPSSRRVLIQVAFLAVAFAALFAFGCENRGYFYRFRDNAFSAKNLALAENLSPRHGFRLFLRRVPSSDGSADYVMYSRFPIGGHALIKLAALPFGDDLSAKIFAARSLMLLMHAAAALLFFLAIFRLLANAWIALIAVLAAFSSFYPLYLSDVVFNEGAMDLFAVALAFHGMAVFVREGRFGQLLAKTLAALLIGWHVYALAMPFAAFGLAREIRAAPRRERVSALLRSRRFALGIAAPLFGAALIALNLTSEYAAYGGEIPLSRLPSVSSAAHRLGVNAELEGQSADEPARRGFLRAQFSRALEGFVPFIVSRHSEYPPERGGAGASRSAAILGALAAAAALAAALASPRDKALWAALALMGFFWGFSLPSQTYAHPHEGLFYIGVPLALISLALAAALRLRRRFGARVAADRALAVLAALALAAFCASAFQMARIAPPPDSEKERGRLADFQAIRDIAGEGKTVFVDTSSARGEARRVFGSRHATDFYLSGNAVGFDDRPETPITGAAWLSDVRLPPGAIAPDGSLAFDMRLADYDFTVAARKIPGADTLTPDNRTVFLYGAHPLDVFAAEYRDMTSAEPVAKSEFDIYIDDSETRLGYAKEPCSASDVETGFFLYIYPADVSDLSESDRERGFEARHFDFLRMGDASNVFNGKCYAAVALPAHPIARIQTGQFVPGGSRLWDAAFLTPSERERMRRYEPSGEPAARSDFDIYVEGRSLIYVKSACGERDSRGRFFLSVHPADAADLPEDRREIGHDSLNFDFAEFGAASGGGCVIRRPLPGYRIQKIETGQWIPGETGHLWSAEFAVGE